MKQEIKICLPAYKIIYSICFFVILSLIRGISYAYEIGIAIIPNMALLTIVFSAETYVMERSGKRWEIISLLSKKSKQVLIVRRLLMEDLYLFLLSSFAYFFFYWQKPIELEDSFITLYGIYLIAEITMIFFWSVLSLVISNLFRNQWIGIGGSLVIWLTVNSKFGEQILGKFNIFAFVFRDVETGSYDWLYGSILGVLIAGVLLIVYLSGKKINI